MPLRILVDKRRTAINDIAPCGMNCRVCYATMREKGIREFVRAENSRWICAKCGKKLCVHVTGCPGCGHAWRPR